MEKNVRNIQQIARLVMETAVTKNFNNEFFVIRKELGFGKFKGKTLEAYQCVVPNDPDIYLKGRTSRKNQKKIRGALIASAKTGKDFTTNSKPRPDRKLSWRIV